VSDNYSGSFFKVNIFFLLQSLITFKTFLLFLATIILFLLSCAPAKRFPDNKETERKIEEQKTKEGND